MAYGMTPPSVLLNPRKLLRTPSFVGDGSEVERGADAPQMRQQQPNAMQQIAAAAQTPDARTPDFNPNADKSPSIIAPEQPQSPAMQQIGQIANDRYRNPTNDPAKLPSATPGVQIPPLDRSAPGEPPRTLPKAFIEAAREPDVAGMNFGMNPQARTVPTQEITSTGHGREKQVTSKPGGSFAPVDYHYDPIGRAAQENRDEYSLNPNPPSRLHEALKTAGIAFLKGAASNPHNPLAAGLGAAAAGGVGGAVSPTNANDFNWETIERPQMEEDQARRQAGASREHAARQAAMDEIAKAANIKHTQAQTEDLPLERKLKEEQLRRQEAQDKATQFRLEQEAKDRQSHQKAMEEHWKTGDSQRAKRVDQQGNPILTPTEERKQADVEAHSNAYRDAQSDPEWGVRYLDPQSRQMLATGTKKVQKRENNQPVFDAEGKPVLTDVPLAPGELKSLSDQLSKAKEREIEVRKSYYLGEGAKKSSKKGTAKSSTSTAPRTLDELMPLLK